MDVVQLHFSVLTVKLIGYFLGIFFAAKAFNRFNNLNIDIGGHLIRVDIHLFLIPLFILLISPIFDVLYEVYEIHTFQHVSMITEGISGLFFTFAFLRLHKTLESD